MLGVIPPHNHAYYFIAHHHGCITNRVIGCRVQSSSWYRRTLGIVTILWSFGVASLIGRLQDFNANVYFTGASKDLLSASVEQLKAGKTEAVIREWSRAEASFNRPTRTAPDTGRLLTKPSKR
jgi:hypothetical protein